VGTDVTFGWFLPTYGDSRTVGDPATFMAPSNEVFLRVASAAERAGFEYLLVPVATECWEAWITTAVMAGQTSRIKMLVAARPGLIQPTLMAKMIATFDQLTGGRVCINLIAGGGEAELAADGVYLDHNERYEVMDETVTLMKQAWAAKTPFDWKGRHFEVRGALVRPRPLQQPHPPFYIGGISPAAVDVGAKHADVYLFWGNTTEQIRADIAAVADRAAAHGRGGSLRYGMRLQVLVREDAAQARRDAEALIANATAGARQRRMGPQMGAQSHADGRMRRFAVEAEEDGWWIGPHLWAGITTVRHGAGVMVVGDPEQVAETLQGYVDLGCTTFCMSGYPHDEEAERFGALVMPFFR
jgi:alkanesulfonate monooxygenase